MSTHAADPRCFLHPLLLHRASDPLGDLVTRQRSRPDNGKTGRGMARREDVPEAQLPLRESRLHRRRPHHLPESQRAVRLHEVIEAAEELQVVVQRPPLARVTRGAVLTVT